MRAIGRSLKRCAKPSSAHTDLIERLSLDEAYLDVSENKTQVARTIREQIRLELDLTASAGVGRTSFSRRLLPIGKSRTAFLSRIQDTHSQLHARLSACALRRVDEP